MAVICKLASEAETADI